MKKELFDELLQSVKQGGEIMKGTLKPARVLLQVAAKHPDALLDLASNRKTRKR